MSEAGAQLVCAQEALDLLNCVTQTPYDQEKCVRLLQSLRECVLSKVVYGEMDDPAKILMALKVKKFTLAEQEQPAAMSTSEKKS